MTMNIYKLPKLAPIETGYREAPELPLIPFSMDVAKKGCAAPHRHPRGQFIYASAGVMRTVCGRDSLVVPPSQGLWVPPWEEHQVYFPGRTSLRNLFISPEASKRLPSNCCVLKVAPLLRELILKAMDIGEGYRKGDAGWRLVRVLLDELAAAEVSPMRLPMPSDERIARVAEALLKKPGDKRGVESWARLACASSRTLARLFVEETGLSFGAWRQKLRLQKALEGLGKGTPVCALALELGYESSSAFIEMFKRETGTLPGSCLRNR